MPLSSTLQHGSSFFGGTKRGHRVLQHLLEADWNLTPTVVLAELRKKYEQTGKEDEEFDRDLGKPNPAFVGVGKSPLSSLNARDASGFLKRDKDFPFSPKIRGRSHELL